ncbi:MAG: vanillate O-demethylase oxidoreductase VanB, partial [Steroidobacteraceae bacterium]
MTNQIEKQIELKAPVERVWRALADFREFGSWFGVKLDAPFEVGKTARGRITHPGYEHIV